jgi:hypothetical protein
MTSIASSRYKPYLETDDGLIQEVKKQNHARNFKINSCEHINENLKSRFYDGSH